MSGEVWLGLAKPGVVGTWFGAGLPDLPVKGGPTMTIRITDDTMTLEIDNVGCADNDPLVMALRAELR